MKWPHSLLRNLWQEPCLNSRKSQEKSLMPWGIWANTEGNEHFPNTRQRTKKKKLGILVRFDHAAKHRSLRPPSPRINTRSSHLSLWFSHISGMNILWFSTFSSACSGSSLSLTYDSELWSQAQLASKIYSKRPGLGPVGWWENWMAHVGASVLCGLGVLPSWSCSGACVDASVFI